MREENGLKVFEDLIDNASKKYGFDKNRIDVNRYMDGTYTIYIDGEVWSNYTTAIDTSYALLNILIGMEIVKGD